MIVFAFHRVYSMQALKLHEDSKTEQLIDFLDDVCKLRCVLSHSVPVVGSYSRQAVADILVQSSTLS